MKLKNELFGVMPGLLLAFSIAFAAWYLGTLFPVAGGPVFGIIIGMLVSFWKRPQVFNRGIKFTSKKLLQAAIILLGFEMNLFNVLKVGSQSLLIMVFTLIAAFITSWLVGYVLKVEGNIGTLIGVGTAICGGSAIAATAPVINADDKEVAYSISTIFLFNVAAVFIFPFVGHLTNMSDTGFGIWAGTAINDTSSVVAAAYSYSDTAGNLATIVKLTRTLMIVPITLVLSIYYSSRGDGVNGFRLIKVFPWFILGFLAASMVRTMGIIPSSFSGLLVQTGKYLIIMAMSAIGLNTSLKQMIGNGFKPILLGLSCWIAVAIVSQIVQFTLGLQ
ncbi:MAG: YeiH family protein [Bacillota bacterium]